MNAHEAKKSITTVNVKNFIENLADHIYLAIKVIILFVVNIC